MFNLSYEVDSIILDLCLLITEIICKIILDFLVTKVCEVPSDQDNPKLFSKHVCQLIIGKLITTLVLEC